MASRKGYIGGRFGGHSGSKSRQGPQGGREDGSMIYYYYCKELLLK